VTGMQVLGGFGQGVGRGLRLCGRLSFGLLPLFFAALPFTAWRGVPGHDLLGGMFVELSFWQVFLTLVPLIVGSWSAMTVLGLTVEGAKLDAKVDLTAELPRWAQAFALPPRPTTFLAFPLIGATPGAIVIVAASGRAVTGLAAALAALVAYLGATLVAVPLSAAEPGYQVVPGWLPRRFSSWISARRSFTSVIITLRRWATVLVRCPPFDGALDAQRQQIDIDHFVAMGLAVATFLLFLIEAFFFRPWAHQAATLPSAAVLFTLGTFLIWGLGALSFHLRRYSLSPVLVLAMAALAGAGFSNYDHHFHVRRLPAAATAAPSPVDVARTVGDGNLVVVTATGGGILAAGWTTLALQKLIAERPALLREIRVVSAVSGGAVGAAFYTHRLRGFPPTSSDKERLDLLERVHVDSVRSSLDAVAYGLLYLDLPRLFSADILFSWTGMDRASLLERRWREVAGKDNVSLHDLGGAVRSGDLPATIFNLTAMETGRRVMATPVVFDQGPTYRALTLDEYLLGPEPPATSTLPPTELADLDFWTAARLSATFPFVTPAARAMIDHQLRPGRAGHHMIDGGYNDNYGVASALDFLRPVMEARKQGPLTFRRLLIIQLRSASPRSRPPQPRSGFEAALIGPLLGILQVRDGATLPRNEAALEQFIRLWDSVGGVAVETLVFEPAPTTDTSGIDAEEPNSWHLSEAHKQALRRRWDRQPHLADNLARLRAFLAPPPPAPAPAPP
jgi:hypothetical protein